MQLLRAEDIFASNCLTKGFRT